MALKMCALTGYVNVPTDTANKERDSGGNV